MIDTYKVYYNERLPGCRVRVLGREGGAPYDGHTRDPQRLRAIHHHVAQRAAAGLAHEPRPAARVVLATHRLVSCSYYFRYYLYLMFISDNTLLTLGPASQQPVPVLEPGKGQQVSPRSQQVSWSGHSLCSDPQSPRPRVCSRTLPGPRNVNKALGVKGITFGLFMPCRTKAK